MCGRFALSSPPTELQKFVDFVNLPNIEPRYNITPGQPVSLIRVEGETQIMPVNWGLVPGWASADYMARPGARPLINARAETIQTKPSFKNAFRRRRALLPADGFYEWERKARQPYLIRHADAQPFFMVTVGKQILVAKTVEKSLHTTTECLYSSLIGVRGCLFGSIAQPG